MGQLFQSILREPYSHTLRAALISREGTDAILRLIFHVPEPPIVPGTPQTVVTTAPNGAATAQQVQELHYQGVRLVRTLSKFHPDWLASDRSIIQALLCLWVHDIQMSRLQAGNPDSVRNFTFLKLAVKTVIQYCRMVPSDVKPVFDMLAAFTHESFCDFSFLKDFYSSMDNYVLAKP